MSSEACLGTDFAISYFFFINLQDKNLFVNYFPKNMMPVIYFSHLLVPFSYVLKLWFIRLENLMQLTQIRSPNQSNENWWNRSIFNPISFFYLLLSFWKSAVRFFTANPLRDNVCCWCL